MTAMADERCERMGKDEVKLNGGRDVFDNSENEGSWLRHLVRFAHGNGRNGDGLKRTPSRLSPRR